jgi:phosphatidylinositol alpha-1,6-mannosyltransferase
MSRAACLEAPAGANAPICEKCSVRRSVLLVTELFPPTIGGSGELFANVYSRLNVAGTTVLCDAPAAGDATPRPLRDLTILRERIKATNWGVLGRGALTHHLRSARRIQTLSANAVVHCGRILPEGVAAMLARGFGGSPYVCWAHGEELAYAASSRELRTLLRLVARRAAALVANSHNTAGILRDMGAAAGAIHVVHPGVDAERFRPGLEAGARLRRGLAAADETVLLTVGRLQRRKGHDLVLRALPAILRHTPRLRYVIAGDGEQRADLEQLAAALGVREHVTFAGRIPAEDLPAYYGAADLFVHPNRTDGADFEGFGIVFLEAAAAGLPVIAGNTGGAPEAIADGETGLLVSGTDENEVATSVITLLSDRTFAAKLGAAGRRRAQHEFTWEAASHQVRLVHEQVEANT